MQLLTANIECICTSSCYSILARYVYKLHFNLNVYFISRHDTVMYGRYLSIK